MDSARALMGLPLFAPRGAAQLEEVNPILAAHHYLGPVSRGFAYRDEFGVLVFANPSSRRLPQSVWLDLTRWCLPRGGAPNAGSRQWARVREWLLRHLPEATTVVSYSDPAVGHTGALYRACNWLWAPTWHRLRPPPSGNGNWGTGQQAVKDRWVDPLRPDPSRAARLAVQDESLTARFPWAGYVEPRWSHGRRRGGGGDFKRWVAEPARAQPGRAK